MHSCLQSYQASPGGTGGERRHPRAHENTGIGADKPEACRAVTQGVADGDASAELLKLAVRKIVAETLEGRGGRGGRPGHDANGPTPGAGDWNGYRRGRLLSTRDIEAAFTHATGASR